MTKKLRRLLSLHDDFKKRCKTNTFICLMTYKNNGKFESFNIGTTLSRPLAILYYQATKGEYKIL